MTKKERTRRYARLFAMAFVSALLATAPRADPIPLALQGKSLVLEWSRTFTTTGVCGTRELCYRWNSMVAKAYVSSQGRVFSSFQQLGAGKHFDVSGGVKNLLNWRFEGGALIADQAFEQGARRVIVRFDEGFGACSVEVVYGKADGTKTIVVKNESGWVVEEDNNTISSTSCSVHQGNLFGNPR